MGSTALDPSTRESGARGAKRHPALGLSFTIDQTARFERRLAANPNLTGIPVKKTMEQFDFDIQPSAPKATIDEPATSRLVG